MKLKKPKFWDYKKPNFFSYLLLPLTFPIIINNFFLNLKKNDKNSEKIKKICIGNIYIGGTSKTPLTIKIFEILSNLGIKVATIKKFYPKHFDEQKLLSKRTKLYTSERRNMALSKAIHDNVQVAIFDDGLQDHSINYDLKFVCFNNKKGIGNGFLIPAGPLREKIESIFKYDAVFINGNENDNSDLKTLIRKYKNDIQIFETCYKPMNINQFDINEKYIIFSGIGNPDIFKETLIKNNLKIVKEIIFPDHYNYTKTDINNIKLQAKKLNAKILTTEKDHIKIDLDLSKDIKFLKINIEIKNEEKLINYLKQSI
jgi:tetraacyldisaccharide 4'-kinase|tara:strand:+ start:1245 stop:2186 length:942 start_codon:yes stop_codon:yes gene_type:complete